MLNDCSEVLSGWKESGGSFFPPVLVSPPSQEVPKQSSKLQLLDEPREVGARTRVPPRCSTAWVQNVSQGFKEWPDKSTGKKNPCRGLGGLESPG